MVGSRTERQDETREEGRGRRTDEREQVTGEAGEGGGARGAGEGGREG